ncbi:uncharacterized protein LOC109135529 [Beta vulgaris subsp. vulgaris]|uniref:uncharacterized protein LOC109135529 n=1 Tax=Beta vulgaris subsp. vulgaris TaxID=3555 RepID=UPI0020373301|nr:uncharacterized protein LOC109135529 [Beta vulgaris subsp. vulgaris]
MGNGALFGSHCSLTNASLEKVAIARGLHGVDELLVQLGKQKNGVSTEEAFNILEKELGLSAFGDVINSEVYAGGMNGSTCKRLLRRYKEAMESKDELRVRGKMHLLKKHCGYKPTTLQG